LTIKAKDRTRIEATEIKVMTRTVKYTRMDCRIDEYVLK